MGNSTTRLGKEDLEELQKGTHFDQKEIKELYRQFKKEIQPGTINKKEFSTILKATGFGDVFLQDLMFNVFDRNKDGVISFREFVAGLSVMTRGSPDEKMEFVFAMLDLDGDGAITKSELTQVLDSFYKLVGPLIAYTGKKYDNADQLVEEFFLQMDADGDGKVTLEEYKEGAMKSHDIVHGLKLFSD